MALIIVGVVIVTSIVTVWLTMMFLFPKEFRPVNLSEREEKVLEEKISRLDTTGISDRAGREDSKMKPEKPVKPEKYSEEGANREIRFTEREINGLIANNTNLATRLAIDLSDDLASAKLLIPMEPDFPILGGKTLKVTAGLALKYANGKPVIALRGVSLMGVPVPNAWLGNIKNVDLVKEFGNEAGFWKSFSDGIEDIRVEDGKITVKLRE
ncbi:MAG: arginine N-succinyltransferase [Deltaproteobacteria bacterium]|nr:arginine N-succinyltransferase [Deltaproteobacteria bacterium]